MIRTVAQTELYRASIEWIQANCTPAHALAAAAGVDPDFIGDLDRVGLLPAPTYEVSLTSIRSPIWTLGQSDMGAAFHYYGLAILGWIRRAAAARATCGFDEVERILRQWWTEDFRAALVADADRCSRFGWAHLYHDGGTVDEHASAVAADALWLEWLRGGWAICLNHFDGRHVVGKDMELERIPALAQEYDRDPVSSFDLLDAMLHFDSLTRMFAPFERSASSRFRVIDMIAVEHDLPWPERDILMIAPEHAHA